MMNNLVDNKQQNNLRQQLLKQDDEQWLKQPTTVRKITELLLERQKLLIDAMVYQKLDETGVNFVMQKLTEAKAITMVVTKLDPNFKETNMNIL